jgi:DNA-binding response OmpR family regulator
MIAICVAAAERKFARAVRSQLIGEGYRPWLAEADAPLPDQLRDRGAELILLDYALPPGDPARWVRALKKQREFRHIPIIALVEPREAAALDFSAGLEDFVVKSEALEELNVRIRFALWRLARLDSQDTMQAGDLVMNLASYQVRVGDEDIYPTYKEFELLRFLMTHRGRVFSRDALLHHVWGEDYLGGTRTVDVHIRRLRAKIGPRFDDLIQTVRNVGYKMVEHHTS